MRGARDINITMSVPSLAELRLAHRRLDQCALAVKWFNGDVQVFGYVWLDMGDGLDR